MSIFNKKYIRKLIDLKWPLTREFTVRRLFVPYIIFLAIYNLYVYFLFPYKEDADFTKTFMYVVEVFLLIFSAYFMILESR